MTTQQQAPALSPNMKMLADAIKFDNLPSSTINKIRSLYCSGLILQSAREMAFYYTSTGMCPKAFQGKPEDAAVAIMWGNSLGLGELESLKNVAVINGSPCLWGDALVALVKRDKSCNYIHTEYDETTQTATVTTQRGEEPVEARTFSMQEAIQAGLANRNPVYKAYPKRMICARARSHVLRDVYPDLLHGFDIAEVVEDDQYTINDAGRREIDVTGKGATLSEILTSVDKPSETPEQTKKESPEPTQAAPAEQEQTEIQEAQSIFGDTITEEVVLSALESYKKEIKDANNKVELNAVGTKLAKDEELPFDEKEELKALYMDKFSELM